MRAITQDHISNRHPLVYREAAAEDSQTKEKGGAGQYNYRAIKRFFGIGKKHGGEQSARQDARARHVLLFIYSSTTTTNTRLEAKGGVTMSPTPSSLI